MSLTKSHNQFSAYLRGKRMSIKYLIEERLAPRHLENKKIFEVSNWEISPLSQEMNPEFKENRK